jgi:hypothetical protein
MFLVSPVDHICFLSWLSQGVYFDLEIDYRGDLIGGHIMHCEYQDVLFVITRILTRFSVHVMPNKVLLEKVACLLVLHAD